MDHRHDYEIEDRFSHLAGLLRPHAHRHDMSRADRHDIHAKLTAHPLFSDLTPGEHKDLVRASHPFAYPPKWTINTQSECADLCLLVLEGTVQLKDNHGEPRIVGPGEFIGLTDAANQRVPHEVGVSQTRITGIAIESGALLAALRPRHSARIPQMVPARVTLTD